MSTPAGGAVPSGGRDPGLQPERTALAWQRTALAVVAGSLVAARLLAPRAGAAALALGGTGVLLGLALLGAAALRASRTAAGAPAGGRLVAAVAAGVLVLGLAGAAVVVVPLL